MEAVVKNLASTAELLAVAQSGAVEQWDRQAVQRAFQWARYCEQLFSRFHTNPAVRDVMDKQLQLSNESLRSVFRGYTEVSFSEFARCQDLLLVRLLNNPVLPSSVIKLLLDAPLNTNESDATGLCTQLIECKSACKVLSALNVGPTSAPGAGADAELQGLMLMERLDAMLRQDTRKAEHFLDAVLQNCEGTEEKVCLVVAAALLAGKNTAAGNVSEDFLLNWLQQKHGLMQNLCSTLPTGLLLELARENMKFSVAYCDVLKKWASDMEYDVNEGEWVQTCSTNTEVSFKKLTEHFLALIEACPSMRENVERELHVLKVSDGNFDVRGLSVWGDLLLEMKM
ncbi:Fanconi anemia group F protein [Myripristis murdjan]|uniref:FA complementation group F n=1 Tax=Myripristis murdjan TaxID=586833 RepID=A0A667ZKU2_9TELE|nr:Fanconi anemia group F protein [Myripristis murdjan]